jgi:hypothetical protein
MHRHAGRQWSRALVTWTLECVEQALYVRREKSS